MGRVAILVLVVTLAGVCAQAAGTAKHPSTTVRDAASRDASGAQLRKRIQEIIDAKSIGDPKAAEPYYSKDAKLVFFDIEPREYKGWDQYQAGAAKFFGKYQEVSLKLNEDAEVHWRSDLAWVTATWHLDGVLNDGSKQSLELRWTLILENLNGEWLAVHEHTSAPAPAAAVPAVQPALPEKEIPEEKEEELKPPATNPREQ